MFTTPVTRVTIYYVIKATFYDFVTFVIVSDNPSNINITFSVCNSIHCVYVPLFFKYTHVFTINFTCSILNIETGTGIMSNDGGKEKSSPFRLDSPFLPVQGLIFPASVHVYLCSCKRNNVVDKFFQIGRKNNFFSCIGNFYRGNWVRLNFWVVFILFGMQFYGFFHDFFHFFQSSSHTGFFRVLFKFLHLFLGFFP